MLSKLLKHRRNLSKPQNKASGTKKTEKKKQSKPLDRKCENKLSKHRNKESIKRISPKSVNEQSMQAALALDKIINKCFSGLVANQNATNSFATEMKAEDGLSDQFKVLNIKSDKRAPILKLTDFPIERAANSIIPLCLENFSFVTEVNSDEENSEMFYHNLVGRISELLDIKAKIKQILGRIEEIEQPNRILYVDGSWQPKKLTESEQLMTENFKLQLAELYFQSESIRLDHHIPEQLMDIGEKQLLKEVIANVKNARGTPEELSAELLGVIRVVSESTDISLAKLVQETNNDTELSMIPQAIIDGAFEHVPTHYQARKNDMSAEMGMVFYKNKIVIPNRMQEWILQVAHGDHESSEKMKEMCERVHWETKERDIAEKANNCLTCFRTGKNLKCMLPKTEINTLPRSRKVGEEVQIDFAGPFFDEKQRKRFIILAIDNCTRWPFAIVCKKCNSESVLELLAIICENIGLPKKL